MHESTNATGGGPDAYAAHIKPGDAVETPDGELWVVESVRKDKLHLLSACRDSQGQICADTHDATSTLVPPRFATKVADARRVRR